MTDRENMDLIVETVGRMGPCTFAQLAKWCKDINVDKNPGRYRSGLEDFKRAFNLCLMGDKIVAVSNGRVALP